MVILVAAVALYWRARFEHGARPRSSDRLVTWSARALVLLGGATLAVGTVVTAAGPHSGATKGENVGRLDFRGAQTLEWIVQRHGSLAVVFFLASVAVLLLARSRKADPLLVRTLHVLVGLIFVQLVVGITQWLLKLPAELVWVHVGLATIIWIWLLLAVAAAGQLESSPAPVVSAE